MFAHSEKKSLFWRKVIHTNVEGYMYMGQGIQEWTK